MRLVDLPITLRDRALKYGAKHYSTKERSVYSHLISNHNWGQSNEGALFWYNVNEGEFSRTLRKEYRNIE